jgi:hypothetical protein
MSARNSGGINGSLGTMSTRTVELAERAWKQEHT